MHSTSTDNDTNETNGDRNGDPATGTSHSETCFIAFEQGGKHKKMALVNVVNMVRSSSPLIATLAL